VCPVTNKEVVARPRPPKPDRDANEASAPFSILKPNKPAPSAYVTPVPEGEPSLVGHLLESKYLVRELIGRGGMGAVYSAENQRIGKQVAIKMLTRGHDAGSNSMKRFYREARIMGSLGHPNIVEIYDLGALDNGVPFQVMELLEGQTLAARIEVEGGMPIEDAVEIGEQVLSGLEAAHQRGIVHRDLKPDNVFLAQREGRTIVKLLDFGISKTIGEETLSLTKTGMVVGTPFYLAPEQARGDDVDQRIDVWAMGVLLYEMLTGTTPFRAENYNKLIVRILTTRAEPPSTRQPRLSPELEKVIMTALSHDRDDRYADAGEMLAAFQQAKRGEQPNPPLPRERATSLDVDVSVEGEDYDPTEVSDAFRR